MSATSKTKWIGSIILASILLALALTGGKWGTSYSASANVSAVPNITALFPALVAAGSGDTTLIISGSNLGNTHDTGVRFRTSGYDKVLHPKYVLSDGLGLSVVISDTLLVDPTVYTVTVVMSTKGTVPEIPLWSEWDVQSNWLPFTVFTPLYTLLPLIRR